MVPEWVLSYVEPALVNLFFLGGEFQHKCFITWYQHRCFSCGAGTDAALHMAPTLFYTTPAHHMHTHIDIRNFLCHACVPLYSSSFLSLLLSLFSHIISSSPPVISSVSYYLIVFSFFYFSHQISFIPHSSSSFSPFTPLSLSFITKSFPAT